MLMKTKQLYVLEDLLVILMSTFYYNSLRKSRGISLPTDFNLPIA